MKLRGPANLDVSFNYLVNRQVYWHNTIASIPHDYPSLIIGHEFLDALPIQKFQYTKKGWREIMIDLKGQMDIDEGDEKQSTTVEKTAEGETKIEFKEILCPHNNIATAAMLGGIYEGEQIEQNTHNNESGKISIFISYSLAFINHMKLRKKLLEEEVKKSGGLVNSTGKPTASAIPLVSSTGKPLSSSEQPIHISEDIDTVMKQKKGIEVKQPPKVDPTLSVYDAKEGDTIEVCPEAGILIQDIIMWLEDTKGSALFIDYGNNYAAENSLRGIKNHQFVSYLQEPGEIDITADVDFKSIGKIVKNSKSDIVKYYGPIPQVLI